MSKKENKDRLTFNYLKANVIFIISAVFVIPLLVATILWIVDMQFLNTNTDWIQSINRHLREIIIGSFCLYILAVYALVSYWNLKKPKKTTSLASQSWSTEEMQREFFGITKIDVNEKLPIGGSPINYLNDNELLYEKEAVHDITVGSTRCGKSRKIVRQLVMICSMADESMIFNDPKKEMYHDFNNYLKNRGYKTYALDFRNQEYSDCWNPLDTIINCFKNKDDPQIDDADQWALDIVTALVKDNGTGEKIWIDGQKALLKGIILSNCQANINDKKKNLYSVYQTLALLGGEKSYNGDPKNKKMELSVYMESLSETDIARTAFTAISNSPERTRGSFMTSALSTINIFSSLKLAKVLGHSDFNFSEFINGKHALFVVNPDEKPTYNDIASVCFDQSYQTLVFEANRMSGRKLPKRVHMIYDEFGNMPAITGMQSKMTVALSRGIVYHLYVQDFAQLLDHYDENIAKIIRGNCNLWYFISSADLSTCREIAEAIGEETIWTDSVSGNYNQSANATGGGLNYSQTKRQLVDANELMVADNRDGNGIIVKRTYFNPSRVYLPDCSKYSWYKEIQTDETEVIKEDRELYYAVPRCFELKEDEIIASARGQTEMLRKLKRFHSNNTSNAPFEKDLYWYWSTRDDLQETVKNNVIEYISTKKAVLSRREIIKYLQSEQFLSFLDPIDKTDELKAKSETYDDVEKTIHIMNSYNTSNIKENLNLVDYSKLSLDDKIENLVEQDLIRLVRVSKEIRNG